MKKQSPVFFARRDLWVIAALLALAFGLWLAAATERDRPAVARFMVGDAVVLETSLFQNGRFSLDELPQMTFEIADGRVAVVASDCPDQLCVGAGWLSRNGQCAVCLPNRLSVLVRGGADGPDTVAGW